MQQSLVGIDIGGTKCAVILGRSDADGGIQFVDKLVMKTDLSKTPNDIIALLCGMADTLISQHGVEPSETAFGISCGNPLDTKRGIIQSPPNLIGWDDVPIVDLFKSRYGVPVGLQNDANACALAEWRFGAAKGCENVVFLTFGTGMGAGLILNGKLYCGAAGMAGEVGHIRLSDFGPVGYGKAGSFEGFCSGGGIANLAKMKVLEEFQKGRNVSFCDRSDMDSLTAKRVAEAALEGDRLATEIYGICGRYLGKGLAVLIDILNPEIIVIGSIFQRQKNLLWDAAQKVIQEECLSYTRNSCSVVPAAFGDGIGDYAALAVAAEALDRGVREG